MMWWLGVVCFFVSGFYAFSATSGHPEQVADCVTAFGLGLSFLAIYLKEGK